MTTRDAASTVADFAGVLDNEGELLALLTKWVAKQLKAKSTNLDRLTIFVRAHGNDRLDTLLTVAPEATVRALARGIDKHNGTLAALPRYELQRHICELATGRRVVAGPPPKAPKSTTQTKATKTKATLLERSKFPKPQAAE